MTVAALSPYGLHRVIGQRGVLPQAADRLDATMPCQATELEISVEHIHVDASSFAQLRRAHGDDAAAVRDALLTLVRHRGKLHNPVTNSGGMLTGAVRRAGTAFPNAPVPGTRITTTKNYYLEEIGFDPQNIRQPAHPWASGTRDPASAAFSGRARGSFFPRRPTNSRVFSSIRVPVFSAIRAQ